MPLAASLAALVAALTVPSPVQATAAPPETTPIYSYAEAIRESVWVQTPTDADQDGVPDRVAVDLVRPDAPGRFPVIMDASPYYSCCGRGNEGELKEYDANGVITKEPLFYDNYFVPRGYAFAGVDLSGTNRSTGCEDVGGPAEVAGAKAVIDWLNGRAPGFTAVSGGSPVSAADWTTGKVGMIGKSWDGSIANGVAATGVDGLATIVPISAISSWYDYMRFNGTLRASGYPSYLQSVVSDRVEECPAVTASLANDSADDTANFNSFWQARDYRPAAGKVKASVFIAHGVNDLNVTTPQFGAWWSALAANNVPRKIWLHQTGHVDPFDVRRDDWVDALHQWFDYWLRGVPNGVMSQPQATVETAPGVFTTQADWPSARTTTLSLGSGIVSYTDASLTEDEAVADPSAAVAGRLAFLYGPATADTRIAGTPSVTLRVKVDKPTTQLTARLVDYGSAARVQYDRGEGVRTLTTESCYGESVSYDDACYRDVVETVAMTDHAVLTRGWLDAAHHTSLRVRTPLKPGRWYTVTVPVSPYDVTLPAGHTLGLVLTQILQMADSTLQSGEQLRQMTSFPCLALLPRVQKRALGTLHIHDYVVRRPLTMFAEQVRSLRAALALDIDHPQVVTITAARPAEGKSLLTIALGRSAQLCGERVLVIECDLRQGTFQHRLGGRASPGLTDVLRGELDWREALQDDPLTGMKFIAGGKPGDDVLGLFLGDEIRQVLAEARADYDLILLDAPPVEAMTEARVAATLADATLLCVRWRSTQAKTVMHAVELLRDVHAKIIGTVLTRVDPHAHVRSGYADAGVYHRRYKAYFRG